MSSPRSLNFLEPRAPSRILRVATAGVFALCLVMTWVVVWGPRGDTGRSASIGDAVGGSSPEAVASPQPADSRRPKAVSTSAVNSLAPGLTPDSVRYYAEQTGAAFSVDLRNGTVATLSERRLAGFMRSWWVPGKRQVVSLFEAKGGREFRSFDYDTGVAAVIGEGATSFALSPRGDSAVYLTGNADVPEIRITGLDGSGDRRLIETRVALADVSWPRGDTIAVTSQRHDRTGADMSLIGTDGSFRRFFEKRENLEYTWSPDGRRLLLSYFVANEGVRLWYRDLEAPADVPLNVPTSAKKCAWHPDGAHVICGVPVNAELARDIPSDMVATADSIISVNLLDGAQAVLFRPEQKTPLGVTEPTLTASGRYFAFVNLFDRRLHFLEL